MVEWIRPGWRRTFPDVAEIVVEEVAFTTGGFSLTLAYRVREALPGYEGQGPLQLLWHGFDQVADDQGYRYLHVGRSESGEPGGGGERRSWIRQAFYPAVAPGARVVTFSSTPARLSVMAPFTRGIELLPEWELGDIVYRAEVVR